MTLILDHITLRLITIIKGIDTTEILVKVKIDIISDLEVEKEKEKIVNIERVIEMKKRKRVIQKKVIIIL